MDPLVQDRTRLDPLEVALHPGVCDHHNNFQGSQEQLNMHDTTHSSNCSIVGNFA
jgi:hypothetical protein